MPDLSYEDFAAGKKELHNMRDKLFTRRATAEKVLSKDSFLKWEKEIEVEKTMLREMLPSCVDVENFSHDSILACAERQAYLKNLVEVLEYLGQETGLEINYAQRILRADLNRIRKTLAYYSNSETDMKNLHRAINRLLKDSTADLRIESPETNSANALYTESCVEYSRLKDEIAKQGVGPRNDFVELVEYMLEHDTTSISFVCLSSLDRLAEEPHVQELQFAPVPEIAQNNGETSQKLESVFEVTEPQSSSAVSQQPASEQLVKVVCDQKLPAVPAVESMQGDGERKHVSPPPVVSRPAPTLVAAQESTFEKLQRRVRSEAEAVGVSPEELKKM